MRELVSEVMDAYTEYATLQGLVEMFVEQIEDARPILEGLVQRLPKDKGFEKEAGAIVMLLTMAEPQALASHRPPSGKSHEDFKAALIEALEVGYLDAQALRSVRENWQAAPGFKPRVVQGGQS